MNLRHAAALALVGWYLMIPRVSKDGAVDDSTPLSKWEQFAAFDTATGCEKARIKLNGCARSLKTPDDVNTITACGGPNPIKRFTEHERLAVVSEFVLQMSSAACIATDDPQPQGKVE